MPIPGATMSGMLARKAIKKQPIAEDIHVAATSDCLTSRCAARQTVSGQGDKIHTVCLKSGRLIYDAIAAAPK